MNVFGKEDFEHVLKDKRLMQKIKAYGKKGVYGFVDIIQELHCDPEKPSNNTIIKPLEYGDGVFILGDDHHWEFREFEDVREQLIESISKYFTKYNEIKNSLGVKLNESRERRVIKHVVCMLLAMYGTISDDLYDELEIDEKTIEEQTDKLKDILRKFDKATMLKLHEFTKKNFKKESGEYVRSNN